MAGQVDPPLATRSARLVSVIVICWGLALAGGALVVAYAADANISRCPDGWTNRGEVQWSHVIGALILTAPGLGCAAWLVVGGRGSARLRWVAVVVAVAVSVLTIVLALAVLPDAPASTTRCFD